MTFFYKFVFPSAWIGMFAVATVVMFVSADSGARDMRWIFLGVTVVGAAAWYWSCMRLKRVKLDAGAFEISNFRQEITVPLTGVERITGSVFMSPELVWLHFRGPTTFGDAVVFMAPIRWFAGFRRHPLVDELRALIERARR
ncbi:MAG TPA: hypothetical protein VID04_08905 [Methylomirabilota bacterium]|jgi:hypothetical protein